MTDVNELPTLDEVIARSLAELRASLVPWVPQIAPSRPNVTVSVSASPTSSNGDAQQPRGQEFTLPEDAAQVLDRILRNPEESIEERWEALHFDRNREGRARAILEQLGFIELTGSIRKQRFFEPTEKGKQWARARGIGLDKFKSGTLHEVVLRRVTRSIARAVQGVKFSRGGPIRGVQPDELVLLAGGGLVVMQVSHCNSPRAEAEAALELAGEGALDLVLVVACGETKQAAIERELEKLVDEQQAAEVGGALQKVRVLDAGIVLADGFDWMSLLGGLAKGGESP